MRWRNLRRQRGVRGGYRIYFVDYSDLQVVVLILVTDKELQAALTDAQRKLLRQSLAGLRKDVERYVKSISTSRGV